ncbi:ATP-binding protein [Frankia sp. Cas3]|uniref:ATP-binding protein n=1 Tax=Frankia sp. Cas3 TaxID=3073926 RepID=UPI002AD52C22|nr:ATP-binding protein [Frankia sp. Cas3]
MVTQSGGDALRRNLTPVVTELLTAEPVIVINGARTAGKSTLLSALATQHDATVLDLDDLSTRPAVEADPVFFMAARSPVFVDEFQHIPELLDAVKAELNRDLRPGRFVLTGSTRYLTMPTLSQSLAGRVHVMTLWPLSQGELNGRRETFVDQVLGDPGSLLAVEGKPTPREEYTQRLIAGGFPLAARRPAGAARNRWFRDYVTTVVERDVLEIRKVRQRGVLPMILRRIAARTGQVLHLADIGRAVGLAQDVVGDYVQLLETVFLVHRLPAFGRTLHSRVTGRPKAHLVDSGLGAYLLGITAQRLENRDPAALTEFGHIMETFVVNEVIKQAGWAETFVEPSHFRTSDGHEVDLVLETDDGTIAAVEVKASSRVPGEDLRGLRLLREKLGSRFTAGTVLYLGERAYQADDRIWVLPVDRLWR